MPRGNEHEPRQAYCPACRQTFDAGERHVCPQATYRDPYFEARAKEQFEARARDQERFDSIMAQVWARLDGQTSTADLDRADRAGQAPPPAPAPLAAPQQGLPDWCPSEADWLAFHRLGIRMELPA